MENLFESLLKSVGKILEGVDFGEPLRDPASKTSTKETPAQPTPEWSKNDFNRHLIQSALNGCQVGTLPSSIDLSGLSYAMNKIVLKAQDGIDYGQIVFSHSGGKIETGETFMRECLLAVCGATQAEVVFKVPSAVISTRSKGNYLEIADFTNLIQHQSFQAAIVLAPRLTLMAIKSEKTPQYSDDVKSKIESWFHSANLEKSLSPEIRLIRFNKSVCSGLNITLYRVTHSDDGAIAQKVV
jgi:hypothetical protein